MRIFVTGATGVIGRRVVPLLVERHSVTAAIRDESARERLTATGAQCAVVDLFEPESLRRAMDGHDTVINLATHIPSAAWKMLFRRYWAENDRIRSTGVANLVDAAVACGVTRFIQESFAPIYPDRGDAWIDEATPLQPSPFNRTIVDAETSVARLVSPNRIGVILRFAAFYGPDAMQLQSIISGVNHGWAAIPGGPRRFISSVSHDDAARAVVAALSARSGVYNIVDDEPLRRADFFGSLASALGKDPPRFLPDWMTKLFGVTGEMLSRSLRISNRKFRQETGWQPLFPSVREGWPAALSGFHPDLHAPTPPSAYAGATPPSSPSV
jgi:nucleoside-diphosphate-sugar epimerase